MSNVIQFRPQPPIRVKTEKPLPPAPSFWLWCAICAPFWAFVWWVS